MRWLGKPLLGALVSFVLLSVTAGVAVVFEPEPAVSPDLMQAAAGIGASFLLAFVVEATWLAPRVRRDGPGERLMWIVTGFAIAGLVAITNLLAFAERDPQSISAYRLWWALVALVFLGLMVCVQPALAHSISDDD